MVDKISTYAGHGVDISKANSRPVEHKGQADRGVSTQVSTAAPKGGTDAVSLTDTATNLKRVELSLSEVPEVNRARVEELRQQIQAGEYKIDLPSLADKLISMEKDLG